MIRRDFHYRIRTKLPRFLVIHYSVTTSPEDTQTALLKRGLSTHYEVDRTGHVHEYLNAGVDVAFHAGEFNERSIGIDLTHMPGEDWPSEQIQAARRLVYDLCQNFEIPKSIAPDNLQFKSTQDVLRSGYGIVRHRNLKATLCPGDFPMESLIEETNP